MSRSRATTSSFSAIDVVVAAIRDDVGAEAGSSTERSEPLARAITTTVMTKPPTRAASMKPRRRTPAEGCGLCGRSSMGISSPRVGPDGRELAKHLQPAMMILWTNEPLIKREMTRQAGTGLGPAHSPNCFDARVWSDVLAAARDGRTRLVVEPTTKLRRPVVESNGCRAGSAWPPERLDRATRSSPGWSRSAPAEPGAMPADPDYLDSPPCQDQATSPALREGNTGGW
jgi:hypothetical protein